MGTDHNHFLQIEEIYFNLQEMRRRTEAALQRFN